MLHEPNASGEKDAAAGYKMRLGIRMFWFYALFYAGFVAINLFNPLLMEMTIFAGLNLATVYGFSLIIVALIAALVYDLACRREEARLSSGREGQKESR